MLIFIQEIYCTGCFTVSKQVIFPFIHINNRGAIMQFIQSSAGSDHYPVLIQGAGKIADFC